MAYTSVKLSDVQAAINAVKTAQSKYSTSLSNTQPKKSALETAQKNLQEANSKLQSLRDAYDKQAYLQNNSTYSNAVDAVKTAEQKYNEARDFLDSGKYYKDNSTYNNYVNAFNSADQKLNQLRDWKDSGRHLEENSTYKNALNAVESKLNTLREAENKLDNWSGNRSGSSWNSAVSAKVAADNAVSAAYNARDKASEAASNAADALIRNQETVRNTAETNFNKTRESLENTANKARETAESNLNVAKNKVDTAVETSRQTAEKAINAQDQLISGSGKTAGLQSVYDKSREDYQNVIDQTQPNLNEYNDAKNNVVNYVNDIKNSLGDVKNTADANAVKTLLGQIDTAVKGTGISDFKDQVSPLISQIDPIKMSGVPQLNSAFKNLSPDVFSNVDRATGMPLLNQAGLDAVLNKYGDNNLSSGQYRDNYNAFGWNSKSDGSSVSRGPAVLGLDMGTISQGMSGGAKGIVKSGTNTAATDDDLKKAAEQVSLDFNSYIRPNKFVPTVSTVMGSSTTEKATAKNSREYTDPVTGETYLARIDSKGNFTNSLDKTALYNDIADKTKDFYVVANALETPGANKPAEHAAVLFKADGSGNLVPVVDQDGKVAASYYKTSTVTHAGWQGQLAELAPLLQMAAFIFAPQLGAALNSAIGGMQVASAVAPTAFTVGAPALTLSTAIGATAVNAISSAIMNAGMSVLTGGDPLKGALSGAVGSVMAVNAADVANNVMGAGDAVSGAKIIAQIAEKANLTPQQVNQIVAAGANSAITSAVAGDPNILKNVAANVAGQLAGAEAKNLVYDALENSDPKLLVAAANAANSVANIATQTAIKGGDISDAITNAAPSIFIGAAQSAAKVPSSTTTPASAPKIETPKTIDDLKNEINKSRTDPSNKIEVAQAVPAGAEIFEGLSRNTAADLAKKFGAWAANDPQFQKLISSAEGIETLKVAGLTELAALASTIGAVAAGGTGATIVGTGVLAAPGSKELRTSMLENPMLGAMGGDSAFAAALVDNYLDSLDKTTNELKSGTIGSLGTGASGQEGKLPEVIVTAKGPSQDVIDQIFNKPITPTDITDVAVQNPEQKVFNLQKQAEDAKNAAMDAAAKYLQNSTVENKAVADKAVLDAEIAQKSADSAKGDLTNQNKDVVTPPTPAPKPEPTPEPVPQPTPQPKPEPEPTPKPIPEPIPTPAPITRPVDELIPIPPTTPTNIVPPTTEVPVTQPITTPVNPVVTPPTTAPTTADTNNITGVLAALAGALGGGKVPTVAGGLSQVPVGYTAVTTPLAKRPIGDLYPVSHTMMSPEEIAARSTTQMVQRGGLVSIR